MRLTPKTTLALIIGDILLFILFSWMGRVSHHMSLGLSAILFTAFPFILTWLIISPTFGVYTAKGMSSLSQAFLRTGAAVLVSIPAAVWLRALLVHHNFDWLFYSVTLLVLLLFFLGWRLLFTRFYLRSVK